LALFTLFQLDAALTTGPHDDSQYVPRNQSDTRECQPYMQQHRQLCHVKRLLLLVGGCVNVHATVMLLLLESLLLLLLLLLLQRFFVFCSVRVVFNFFWKEMERVERVVKRQRTRSRR
jgi:hypothetical protein